MDLKQHFRFNGPVLDAKRLQVLLAIVEEGSVTGAATALGYTPSAISQQLLRLEREAGQPLLDRHSRGMTPTDAGLVLATHARKVLRQGTNFLECQPRMADGFTRCYHKGLAPRRVG